MPDQPRPQDDNPADPLSWDDGWDEDGEPCYKCMGDGYYHDCGEDTCCCANPDVDDVYPCEDCRGTGVMR